MDINKAWESIQENINILAKESLDYYELKQFDRKMPRTIRSKKSYRIEAK
jgi:hypothetical protein